MPHNLAFIAITSRLSPLLSKAQRRWIEKVQERLRVTSAVLGDMKPVKMQGLSGTLLPVIQGLRIDEINTSQSYRKFLVAILLLCKPTGNSSYCHESLLIRP